MFVAPSRRLVHPIRAHIRGSIRLYAAEKLGFEHP